jgi:formate dehydrogenase major subunit
MTYRTANKDIRPSDLLHIHPDDAKKIGLQDGDYALVSSQYGEVSLPVCINTALRNGEVFSTFNDKQVFINKITSPYRDSYVQTPEYKVTAVRVTKILV